MRNSKRVIFVPVVLGEVKNTVELPKRSSFHGINAGNLYLDSIGDIA